ncbi:MAG: ATP-binding protein, partial [Rhodocyclaceae bacterium]
PSLPQWFSGDPARIRQILVTLLTNAVRHSQHGSIVPNVLRTDDELWFSVRDDGMGLTQEEIAELFCPFAEKDHPRYHASCCSRLDMPIAMKEEYC